jgi:hypothetical protein
MSTTTVAETILAELVAHWSLAAPLAAANIHFHVDWYDPKWPDQPQITVTGPISSPNRFFGPKVTAGVPAAGLHLFSFQRFLVNIWVRVPAGEDSDDQSNYAEQMRIEVVKILNEQRAGYTLPIGLVIPLDAGRALHELDRTPRILRYEVTVQANYKT